MKEFPPAVNFKAKRWGRGKAPPCNLWFPPFLRLFLSFSSHLMEGDTNAFSYLAHDWGGVSESWLEKGVAHGTYEKHLRQPALHGDDGLPDVLKLSCIHQRHTEDPEELRWPEDVGFELATGKERHCQLKEGSSYVLQRRQHWVSIAG